jgi:gas vesicle protein
MNNSKIAAAIIGGLAAGLGLGLLFAPQKGSATRAKLFDPFKSREDELKARAARRTGAIKKVAAKAEKPSSAVNAATVKAPEPHETPATIAAKNQPAAIKATAVRPAVKRAPKVTTRSNPGNK